MITKIGERKNLVCHQRELARKKGKTKQAEPKPVPSCVYVEDDSLKKYLQEDTDDEEVPEEEKCCVCRKLTPEKVRQGFVLTIVNWVQCDRFQLSVHLTYCTQIRVVRRLLVSYVIIVNKNKHKYFNGCTFWL